MRRIKRICCFLLQLSKLEQIHDSGSSEAFDKKRTGGKGGKRNGREEALSGCGFEDRSAAACFLRKAKASDALSILFLSPHANGGSLCRRISRIQYLHPAQG